MSFNNRSQNERNTFFTENNPIPEFFLTNPYVNFTVNPAEKLLAFMGIVELISRVIYRTFEQFRLGFSTV